LAVAIAVLAGFALVIANVAGLGLLHSYLLGRVDQQLTIAAQAYTRPPGKTEPDLPGPRPRFFQQLSPELRVYLYNSAGTLDRTSGDTGTHSAPALGSFSSLDGRGASPFTVDDSHGGDSWRVIVAHRPDDGGAAAIAVSLGQANATLARLGTIDASVTVLVLLLLGLAAAWVVRLGLAPLTHMEDIAEEIAAGDLTRRVADTDPHTEAGRLGIALNGMLGQIEGALADRTASEARLRQFLADASHELRTPLTSIQGFAELYRRGGAPPGPELDEAMSRIESEAGRMAVLVADLMMLARMDQERPLDRHPIDLLGIAADAVRDAHARVPQRFVRLEAHGEPATVAGDEPRLRQVATNLISNALQHTPADASIVVRLRQDRLSGAPDPTAVVIGTGPRPDSPSAILEVVDSGPGMTPEQAGRVFERLYRADPSRQRPTGGSGLGLSIVAAIVAKHDGRVELSTAPDGGSAFRVVLPALSGAGPAGLPAAPRGTAGAALTAG
jgi:two-component system OmpR family sensor kinase